MELSGDVIRRPMRIESTRVKKNEFKLTIIRSDNCHILPLGRGCSLNLEIRIVAVAEHFSRKRPLTCLENVLMHACYSCLSKTGDEDE